MRFAALVSSSRASSLQVLFCPAREVTGQTSLLDRAPNSLSLSLSPSHTLSVFCPRHVRTRVRIIRVCETYACPIRCLLVASWRCCSSSTTRPVIGYRPRPTRSTLNSIFSLYLSLSISLPDAFHVRANRENLPLHYCPRSWKMFLKMDVHLLDVSWMYNVFGGREGEGWVV